MGMDYSIKTVGEFMKKKLGWKFPPNSQQFFDRTLLIDLGHDLIARIDLFEVGNTCDRFDGVRVQITHKINGPIDVKEFRFNDYLDRTRNRLDEHPRRPTDSFYCWRTPTDADWYMAHPKDTRPFCEAVENYVNTFRKE